jgi:hypothetical protein
MDPLALAEWIRSGERHRRREARVRRKRLQALGDQAAPAHVDNFSPGKTRSFFDPHHAMVYC